LSKKGDENYKIIIGIKGENGQRIRILLIGEVAYYTNALIASIMARNYRSSRGASSTSF